MQCCALTGRIPCLNASTQGVALGYLVVPLRGGRADARLRPTGTGVPVDDGRPHNGAVAEQSQSPRRFNWHGRNRSPAFQPERLRQDSPGQRPGKEKHPEVYALKGEQPPSWCKVVPLQGEYRAKRLPRALPWAILLCPFGAVERMPGYAQLARGRQLTRGAPTWGAGAEQSQSPRRFNWHGRNRSPAFRPERLRQDSPGQRPGKEKHPEV